MFVVLDEMAGLETMVYQLHRLLHGLSWHGMLGIGNPIHAYGPFFDKFSSEAGHNHLITISVTDSPNVTVEQAWQIYYKILEICPKTAEEIRPQIESKVDEKSPLRTLRLPVDHREDRRVARQYQRDSDPPAGSVPHLTRRPRSSLLAISRPHRLSGKN